MQLSAKRASAWYDNNILDTTLGTNISDKSKKQQSKSQTSNEA